MRLTLRTLLAYLDDTLEAAEIKLIGQKVAESETARDLVAKIKQVTRRRRLTTPPDGGPNERFDANIVAGYLDSELSTEQIAEIERICLESDVHLSEIAACHQILTLVLGEPALVPPTAHQRMYDLEKGGDRVRAARRVARRPVPSTNGENPDDQDENVLGLPFLQQSPWLRWAIPLAAVLLLSLLGGILWRSLDSGPTEQRQIADNRFTRDGKNNNPKDGTEESQPNKPSGDGGNSTKPPTDKPNTPPDQTTSNPPNNPPTTPPIVKPIPTPVAKPSMDRQTAGRFVSKGEILVRAPKEGEWQRVGVGAEVSTGEPLVSLPGFRSELVLTGGVRLLMWGNMRELLPFPLLESSLMLHRNPALDLDLTLERGRIYLTNAKDRGPAQVRLRFKEEVWDITLAQPDTMVGVELWSYYPAEMRFSDGEDPIVQVFLYVAQGAASVRSGYKTFDNLKAPAGPAMLTWSNKGPGIEGPVEIPGPIPAWNPDLPLPQEARSIKAAREELATQLSRPEQVEVALIASLQQEASPERRMLAVRSLAALDVVDPLIDGLGEPGRFDVRQECFFMLRHWLSRDIGQPKRLYDEDKRTGRLVAKQFTLNQAETILDLFDGISPAMRELPATYEVLIAYLKHERLEVRELAIRQLIFLVPQGSKIGYDPAGGVDQRNQRHDEWKKLIPTGKLPPPLPPAPPPSGSK